MNVKASEYSRHGKVNTAFMIAVLPGTSSSKSRSLHGTRHQFRRTCESRQLRCSAASNNVSRRSLIHLLGCGAATHLASLIVTSPSHAGVRLADPDAGQNVIRTDSGLRYYDFTKGSGDVAVSVGDRVRFHLVLGTTGARNGWKIDSTYERDPLVVTVGSGEVVPGLEEGLMGMQVGGRRRCLVPARIGYQSSDDRPVPPGFAEYQRFKNLYLNKDRPYKPDIVFDIEVLRIARKF